MHVTERSFLLNPHSESTRTNGLSLFFAIICVVDVFGVFPIVTLAKAIIDCGFYGILIVVVVCSAQIYTAFLLGKCWIIAERIYPVMKSRNRYPYSALAEITYGKSVSNCVTFLLDLTVFGGGIPNLIVASHTVHMLSSRMSNQNVDISYCYWIIILGISLCPVLWFGSPRDMKCICTLSVLIVASVFMLTISCFLFSSGAINTVAQDAQDITSDIPLWTSILTAYGIIAFQFDIHPTILTIQIDMIDKSKLPKAIVGGFAVSLCMFGITTILSSIKYGKATRSSILETLPKTVALDITAGLTSLQLCLTSAVSNNALYQHLEDCFNISRGFNSKRCILRTILMLLAITLAQSVPRFDLVMSTVGGTLTGPLVFILPPLFYLKILSLQSNHEKLVAIQPSGSNDYSRNFSKSKGNRYKEDKEVFCKVVFSKYSEKVLCLLIIILSVFATAMTSYINFTNAIFSYSNYSKPCIYNISATLLYM